MSPKTILALSLLASQATGAPITFNTALPVAKEDYVTRLITGQTTMENDLGAKLDVSDVSFVAAYGIQQKLAIYTAIPYLEKRFAAPGHAAKASGLGDIKLFARQTIWQRDQHGATNRFAAFGGIEAPTGDDSVADANGLLPRSVQLGSGAIDYFLGFILTHQEFGWEADLSVSHQFQGRNGQFKAGDQTRLDLSLQRRLLPRTLEGEWSGFLYGVVELNAIWNRKSELQGQANPESGGNETTLAIGAQYVTNSWILEAAYRLPVIENRRSNALSLKKGAVLSLRKNF